MVKSLDSGETWTGANTGLPDVGVYTLVADPKAPSTLYAQTGDGLFKTNDGAETWSPVVVKIYAEATTPLGYAPLFFAKALVIDPKNSSTLYAAVLAQCNKENGRPGPTAQACLGHLRAERPYVSAPGVAPEPGWLPEPLIPHSFLI